MEGKRKKEIKINNNNNKEEKYQVFSPYTFSIGSQVLIRNNVYKHIYKQITK